MPIGGTAFYGQNQHPRITTNYLNQLNRHGDPGAGVPVSTAEVSGSIVQEYLGFAGGKLTITDPWAPQFADPAVGPLYGGVYQYVRLNPLDFSPLVRGAVVFWDDELHYIITAKPAANPMDTYSSVNKIAGVAVNETFPGNWDFIQIAGIASVLFGFNDSGNAYPGNLVRIVPPWQDPNPPVRVITSNTGALHQHSIGQVVLASVPRFAIGAVQLNILQGMNF